MGYCNRTGPVEPQTGVNTHSQALTHEDPQEALGKTGSKAKQPERISWLCRHKGQEQVPLRERHEIPPLDQTLLSKALHIWGTGSKPCHTQGMSRPMMVRKTEKITPEQGTRKFLTPGSVDLLSICGEAQLPSQVLHVKQSQPKGGGNKMVKP